VREYIWLPEAEIAPTSGSRPAVARPMAVVSDVSTSPLLSWVHVDHLHRSIRITSAAKLQVWEAVWQPWGEAHSINGSVALDARFPGQWFQIEAGLHYNWHRHYDPSIGRYTQPDPLGFVDGPSVYGYAKGRPQQLTDSDGRQVSIPLSLPAICAANPWLCGAAAIGTGLYMCYKVVARGGGGNNKDDCDKEWADARDMCRDELSKPNPNRGITGGYTDIENCARGLVSERCGGNPVARGPWSPRTSGRPKF
jgi:RHS repeat-associated protein